MFKTFVNKILKKSGYSLQRLPVGCNPLVNVFQSTYKKKVLLSYIKNVFENPLVNKVDKKHTNRYTTFLIGQIIHELGYQVDVVNYTDHFNGNFSDYDFVIGLGQPLDDVLELRKQNWKTRVIYFATGCNPFYSNPITIKRIVDFYQLHQQILLSSSRYIKEDWPLQHECADWIIVHGSQFAKSTFRNYRIDSVYGPVFLRPEILKTDIQWESARKNYIWFGSQGAIHKGLDLVLDAFINRDDIFLHVCGNLSHESGFLDYCQALAAKHKNIILHGFVDLDSDLFCQIMSDSAFVIYPSASEGNSPAVITCMANGGLIPLITENADVDLDQYGIIINDLTVSSVSKALEESINMTLDQLKKQHTRILEKTRYLHSFDYFTSDFKEKLKNVINTLQG